MYQQVSVKYWLNLSEIENGINQYLTDTNQYLTNI